jgi:hypothetical protein
MICLCLCSTGSAHTPIYSSRAIQSPFDIYEYKASRTSTRTATRYRRTSIRFQRLQRNSLPWLRRSPPPANPSRNSRRISSKHYLISNFNRITATRAWHEWLFACRTATERSSRQYLRFPCIHTAYMDGSCLFLYNGH